MMKVLLSACLAFTKRDLAITVILHEVSSVVQKLIYSSDVTVVHSCTDSIIKECHGSQVIWST